MNKWAFPLLNQLADGKFHSGEALAHHFGVTRATMFNAVQALQALGVQVFAVRGRGYRLPQAISLLDHAQIMQYMGARGTWLHLQVLEVLDSTNHYVMQTSQKMPHGTCVVAQIQTQGRGRRGRTWVSQLGASLTFSLLWRFGGGPASLSGLSLAVGLAVLRALKALVAASLQVKWPNDLVVLQDGQLAKLAGILIELQGDMDGPCAAVIGIGINLQADAKMQSQINQATVGLSQLSVTSLNPNQVLAEVLTHLAPVLTAFEASGFAPFKSDWNDAHALQHSPVLALMPNGTQIEGQVLDVATDGSLLLETSAGVQKLTVGEVSLRATV